MILSTPPWTTLTAKIRVHPQTQTVTATFNCLRNLPGPRVLSKLAALDEKFVDQGDQLIDVVRTMANKMRAGSENAKRLEMAEAEVARVREVGEATAEKVDNSVARLDQIFHLLQEMRNKAI